MQEQNSEHILAEQKAKIESLSKANEYTYNDGKSLVFIQLRKDFVENTYLRTRLSKYASLAYAVLRHRLTASAERAASGDLTFVDEEGHLFIYYSQETLKDALHCSRRVTVEAMKQLEDNHLIRRAKRPNKGTWLSDIIYVRDFNPPSDTEKELLETSPYIYESINDKKYSFYELPLFILLHPDYKNLSIDAIFAYAAMLDEIPFASKNKQVDDAGRVYLDWSADTIQKLLNCSENKALTIYKELETADLLTREKGRAKNSKLTYLRSPDYLIGKLENGKTSNFAHGHEKCPPSVDGGVECKTSNSAHGSQGENIEICTRKTSKNAHGASCQNRQICTRKTSNFAHGKPQILHTSNPSSLSKTIFSDTYVDHSNLSSSDAAATPSSAKDGSDGFIAGDKEQCFKTLCERVGLNRMIELRPARKKIYTALLWVAAEVLSSTRKSISISGIPYSKANLQPLFETLNSDHLIYVAENLETSNVAIRNPKQYMLASLYNALLYMDAHQQMEEAAGFGLGSAPFDTSDGGLSEALATIERWRKERDNNGS